MEFVVIATFVTWLVVVIVAFGARPAHAANDAEKNFRKRSNSNER